MTQQSTMQPFEKGDVFAGATVLNNPDDDHAGDGRIIQFDADLNEKGVLWTRGTTHLVGGLKFAPDGNLWAFDSHNFKVLRISPEGEQLPDISFPQRAFSNVNFGSDGSIYLGEHLVGHEIKLPPDRPLGTTLPFIPGAEKFGDGHVYKVSADGDVITEYATEVTGGMGGFLGVTCSALATDDKTLVYLSELGPRVMRYDVEADRQLPDLISYDKNSGDMAMFVTYAQDGTLYYISANFQKGFFLHFLDDDGNSARQVELQGRGWATIAPALEDDTAYIGNFFTGTVGKISLNSGEISVRAETNVERALAGLAQYRG